MQHSRAHHTRDLLRARRLRRGEVEGTRRIRAGDPQTMRRRRRGRNIPENWAGARRRRLAVIVLAASAEILRVLLPGLLLERLRQEAGRGDAVMHLRRRGRDGGCGARRVAYYVPTHVHGDDGRAHAIGVRARVLGCAGIADDADHAAVSRHASVAYFAVAGRDGEGFGCGCVGFLLVQEFAEAAYARAGEDAEDVALVLVKFGRGLSAEGEEFVAEEGLHAR